MRKKWKMLAFLIFGFSLFIIIFPLGIYLLSQLLDNLFNLPRINIFWLNLPVGLSIGVFGWLLSFWSVYAQYKYGGGTPAPFMPPVRLVTQGPYRYSRNPMALGNMIFYIGIGIVIGSISFILITIFGFTILFIYNKTVEEKELIERFGEEYIEYMKRTPFFISFRIKKRENCKERV